MALFVAECCSRDNVRVPHTPHSAAGRLETKGLDPDNFTMGDRSAYVGDEMVAKECSDFMVGAHENGYTQFVLDRKSFLEEFGSGLPYERPEFGNQRAIPRDRIPTFNEMTLSTNWVSDAYDMTEPLT